MKLNLFRGMAIFLTQVPLVLFVGAKFDLLFGFNRLDSGFSLLLSLFVGVPLVNLSWIIIETVQLVRASRRRDGTASFSEPLVALLFLAESIAIDFYILSHARM
jgi:hypothetical protein